MSSNYLGAFRMLFGMNGWLLGFVLFTSELLRLIGFPFADIADLNSTS